MAIADKRERQTRSPRRGGRGSSCGVGSKQPQPYSLGAADAALSWLDARPDGIAAAIAVLLRSAGIAPRGAGARSRHRRWACRVSACGTCRAGRFGVRHRPGRTDAHGRRAAQTRSGRRERPLRLSRRPHIPRPATVRRDRRAADGMTLRRRCRHPIPLNALSHRRSAARARLCRERQSACVIRREWRVSRRTDRSLMSHASPADGTYRLTAVQIMRGQEPLPLGTRGG